MSKELQNSQGEEPVITVRLVSKGFGSRVVLKDISLQVVRTQGLCICGVNGAGKSTLLRVIAGLLKPAQGLVRVCGLNVDAEPERTKARLGLISHKSMLYADLTTFENLYFFARLYGIEDGHNRVNELLEDVGLSSYRYEKACVLSRGMLQRLAIARALVHRPVVLLADEPFTGLDTEASRHLVNVLGKFRSDGGTVVMTTHNARIALKCCDRVVVLDDRHFIFDAITSEIDTDRFTDDYLSYARSPD
ncbi:MAG: heme ABC exporter ATP-binding protein CcmA [Planctomycetota bacterium]|jgi:heme exporter protein A